MPQIQYSEKYYDDIYEYRYVRIRVRRFPARLDALFVSLHATNGVRARSRGFPRARRNPRRARRRCPARYRTRARSSIRAIHAFERVRIDRHASRRLRRRVSRAREPRDRGARAYPFEIGSPLTSLPPLPPSTDTSCFPPTSPSSCLRVACSPRYVSEPRYGSTPPPRPNAGDTEARCRNRIAAALDPLPRRLRGSSARLLAPRARVVRSARRN